MVDGAAFKVSFPPAGHGVVRRARPLVAEAFAKASAAGRFEFGRAGERLGVTREAQIKGEKAELDVANLPLACGGPPHRLVAPGRSALRGRGAHRRNVRVAFAEHLTERIAIPGRLTLPKGLGHPEPQRPAARWA